jgi:hypothetical protein
MASSEFGCIRTHSDAIRGKHAHQRGRICDDLVRRTRNVVPAAARTVLNECDEGHALVLLAQCAQALVDQRALHRRATRRVDHQANRPGPVGGEGTLELLLAPLEVDELAAATWPAARTRPKALSSSVTAILLVEEEQVVRLGDQQRPRASDFVIGCDDALQRHDHHARRIANGVPQPITEGDDRARYGA